MENTLRQTWYKFSRRVFACQSCHKKLRVPVKPGKRLSVQCPRCGHQNLIHFKVPFIELFQWRSGMSLKQNLVDFHKRFWNLSLTNKIEILLWLFILAMVADLIIGYFTGLSFSSGNSPEIAPVPDAAITVPKV